MKDDCSDLDLVVVGGGPAGSTLAAFVAMQGHRVMILEKEIFPRYQIGESLLPVTVHAICEMLGAGKALRNAGFVRKNGGTFRWGSSSEPWSFRFQSAGHARPIDESPLEPFTHAYQVERSKFDELLLRNAEQKGARVREGCNVTEVIFEGGRACGVRYVAPSGVESTVHARFVADASGHGSRFYRHTGERIVSDYFQNVAVFGYFEGGGRLPAPEEGNILTEAVTDGWLWYIPLSSQLTSVGAVMGRTHFERLKEQPPSEAFRGFINESQDVRRLLSSAQRIREGVYGRLRVRKDFSYQTSQLWVPGLVVLGDAACFVDPVFSSGVHLATYAGLLAARSINSCLRGTLEETRSFDEFERRYRFEYGLYFKFLVEFYDTNRNEQSYYWSAKRVLDNDLPPLNAFLRLVSGFSSAELDDEIRRHGAGCELAVQTRYGEHRQAESPLCSEGLIPSRDGLHWCSRWDNGNDILIDVL